MDTLIISHRSALARWGEKGLTQRLGGPCPAPGDWTPPSASGIDDKLLRRARLEATPGRPLHILVRDRDERVRTERLVSHVWSGPLPDGAFYQLEPGLLLCSPSFCLRQVCARASAPAAAATVMEVCGGYALSAGAPQGFHERPPLASLEDALPGSRSPMETVVVLFFTLPVELGGCGLPAPQINVRVEIPFDLRAALGRPYLVVDLCWEDQRIILEYDSYTWHLAPRAFDGTQSRNEGLRDEGWMVRTVTSGILSDPRLRQLLVSRVMRRFGLEPPDDEAWLLRQELLVRDLLGIHGA